MKGWQAGRVRRWSARPARPGTGRAPSCPPAPPLMGQEHSMGMLPAASTSPAPCFCAPERRSTTQEPGLSPMTGSLTPCPAPQSWGLWVQGPLTATAGTGSSSSISPITLKVVDKDPTAQGAEEPQTTSGGKEGAGDPRSRAAARGAQPHRQSWGCHREPRLLQVGGEFPPRLTLHVRQRFHSEGVLITRKI